MSKYNKGQQALIDAPADHKAIGVAGAGTGKTTTILARTKRILTENKTGNVLLITFTRAAANDMKTRLDLELNPRPFDDPTALPFQDEAPFIDMRRIMSGTFHSVIGTFIRRYAVDVGLSPNFSVIDENSTKIMYRNLVEANPLYVNFLTKWAMQPNDKKLGKKHFDLAANTASMLVNAATPSELMDGHFSDATLYQLSKTHRTITEENVREVAEFVYKLFKESIADGKRTNTITYDQILFIGYLMAQADMLANERQAFIHTIVDEYQDTNPLQDAFIRYFAGERLTIVGDVDQSIYGFRGGRPTLILDHAKEAQVYNLTMNYRSGQDILNTANRIISHNKIGSTIRKDLEAGRDNPHPGIVDLTIATDDRAETAQIIRDIQELRSHGAEWPDIAILIRSRMTLPEISRELTRAKIPVFDTTKYADFMKSDVMVDTLNFLKVFVNPKDIYAFMGVIDRPKQGIGPATLAKLQEYADKRKMSLVEYLLSKDVKDLTPALKKKIEKFVKTYESVFEAQENNHIDLEHLVGYIFKSFGYEEWLMGLQNSDRYKRDLITLKGVIKNFEEDFHKTHKNPTLFDVANAFVFDMSSVAVREEDKNGVCITTVHNAKGLEWKYVFLIGFEQENFPGTQIVDEEDMESERRLAYVAFTRAKDMLRIFASQNRICYGDQKLTPSSFIREAELEPGRFLKS